MDNQYLNNPEGDEMIDHFLLNQLSEEEARHFDVLLTQEEGLRERVDQRRNLLIAIQESALRDRLDSFHAGIPALSPRVRSIKPLMMAAAIILLFLLPSAWLLLRPSLPVRLYKQYYTADPGLMTTMGTADNYAFEKAMIEYKTGHYEDALAAWKKASRAGGSDTLDYFIGSAYLALKQPAEGLPYFKKVADRQQSAFKSDACWYAGLALLREGNNQEAIAYLRQSSRPEKEALIRKLQ